MPDMLVNLLNVPDAVELIESLSARGIVVRRAQAFEISPVRAFIQRHFTTGWADEVSVGFANKPVSVYIATRDGEIIGFGAYECTRRTFFGPTGVMESERGRGVGKALLLACLRGLYEMGYVYGIIGGVGPAEFYEKAAGATVISGSEPGIYTDMLNKPTTSVPLSRSRRKS
jgi:GNAT superfamily N-acetyltransferase